MLHEKLKSRKTTEPHANSLYYQRDYKRRRENLILCLYYSIHTFIIIISLMTAHLFLSLQVVKLPNCHWHVFSNFTGHEVFRLDRFTAMHLRGATLYRRFAVLLRIDTSECSTRVTPSCYSGVRLRAYSQPETSNSPNLCGSTQRYLPWQWPAAAPRGAARHGSDWQQPQGRSQSSRCSAGRWSCLRETNTLCLREMKSLSLKKGNKSLKSPKYGIGRQNPSINFYSINPQSKFHKQALISM